MVMLEHDDTLHTHYGIERLMYRGRYGAQAVSYTAPQLDPRARPKVLARAPPVHCALHQPDFMHAFIQHTRWRNLHVSVGNRMTPAGLHFLESR